MSVINLNQIIQEELSKVINHNILEDKWMQKSAQDAYDRIKGYYDSDSSEMPPSDAEKHTKFKNHVDKIGRHIGVNINKQDTPQASNGVITYGDGTTETYDQFLGRISELLISKAEEINKEMVDGGAIRPRLFHNPEKGGMDSAKAAELMKFRDALDALNLTFLYDKANQKDLAPKEQKYNIVIKRLEDGGLDVILDKFNLANATPEEIVGWATEGSRKETNFNRFSSVIGKDASSMTKDDLIGNEDVFTTLKIEYQQALVQKILDNAYGLSLNVMGGEEGKVFAYGNAKLPTDTLVVNFTSAHRCPAWNECLVKYACYARTSEHGYKDLLAKNKRLNLMWEGSQYDDELMRCMKNMIRCHCISINGLTNALNREIVKQGRQNYRKNEIKYTEEEIYSRLMDTGFYTFKEDEINVILNNREKIVRINDIRLNEEGDFIGNWLLEAMDEFAGELKMLNINFAAYTCKNLNFKGIKNIIINASRAIIGGRDSEQVDDAIARRFYAVSQDTYNSFDETYASMIAEDGTPIGEPTNPTYITNPTVFGDDYGHIVAYPQPLYDENGNDTGQLYYKCPCGRGKHGKDIKNNPEMSAEFDNLTIPSKTKRLSDIKSSKKSESSVNAVDCYDCRVCYQPKMEGYSKPLIVLVQVHSENADMFDAAQAEARRKDGGKDYGKSFNFQKRKDYFDKTGETFRAEQERLEQEKGGGRKRKSKNESINKGVILEGFGGDFDNDEGLRIVAKNGEESVQRHMSRLGAISENKKIIKKVFNENYNRFFGKSLM